MQVSFRDPDGFVFRAGARVLRCVHPHAADGLNSFLKSGVAHQWMANRTLPVTQILSNGATADLPSSFIRGLSDGCVVLEHEPIPFPNHPYEWAPEMLHAAARLTLELAREGVREGFVLKDATPYNIMFDGPRPVFLDVLSFAPRDPLDPLWRPYAQFVQTFVYPLLANRYFGLRLDELLLMHRDGLEPKRMLRLCSPWRRLMPPFLSSVTLPALFSDGAEAQRFRPRQARDAEEARYLLDRLFRHAQRLADSGIQRHANNGNERTRYMESGHTYSGEAMAAKERFVAEALERHAPADILDIGCNTGHFSLLAASHGAQVVAIDNSSETVGILWRKASAARANVLPLVIDIARPTGASGWANAEHPSFLHRARGRFDCVFMLALAHHLLVNERVPLERIVNLTAELTTRWLILEYVDPGDSQFERIARGREALHRDLTREAFELAVGRRFEFLESAALTPTRRIYLLRRKQG
jgi:SAM-dependent methyltransferase